MTTDGTAAREAFVAALRTAEAALREVPGKLEGARVHDFAFGKMFEATEVRDAYHKRLPETEKDIAEACEVIEHFVSGLSGGQEIGPNTNGLAAVSQGPERVRDGFPWQQPTVPRQAAPAPVPDSEAASQPPSPPPSQPPQPPAAADEAGGPA